VTSSAAGITLASLQASVKSRLETVQGELRRIIRSDFGLIAEVNGHLLQMQGKMFRPMAITVCSAILGSLLLSLTAVPVVSSFVLRRTGAHHDEGWFVRLRTRYLRDLGWALDHPGVTMALALLTVTVALDSAKAITSFKILGFAGTIDENAKTIDLRVPTGTDLSSLVPTITITGASVSPDQLLMDRN